MLICRLGALFLQQHEMNGSLNLCWQYFLRSNLRWPGWTRVKIQISDGELRLSGLESKSERPGWHGYDMCRGEIVGMLGKGWGEREKQMIPLKEAAGKKGEKAALNVIHHKYFSLAASRWCATWKRSNHAFIKGNGNNKHLLAVWYMWREIKS